MFFFDPPWKCQKTFGFLMFSGGGGQKEIFARTEFMTETRAQVSTFSCLSRELVSSQYSILIPPENIRKP